MRVGEADGFNSVLERPDGYQSELVSQPRQARVLWADRETLPQRLNWKAVQDRFLTPTFTCACTSYTVKTCTHTDHKHTEEGNGGRKVANCRTMDGKLRGAWVSTALQCEVLQRMTWPCQRTGSRPKDLSLAKADSQEIQTRPSDRTPVPGVDGS